MSEYAKRAVMEIVAHYAKHVQAMTAEGLHEKSDIAAELAWRDMMIDELAEALEHILRCMPYGGFVQIHHGSATHEQILSALERAKGPV